MTWITGETVSLLLFLLGLYGLIARRNILKSIISLGVLETAAVLFFLSMNLQPDSRPPIGPGEAVMADPLPQALMITAIIIGISVTAVALTMFNTISHQYGSVNWDKIKDRRMEQDMEQDHE